MYSLSTRRACRNLYFHAKFLLPPLNRISENQPIILLFDTSENVCICVSVCMSVWVWCLMYVCVSVECVCVGVMYGCYMSVTRSTTGTQY